MSCNSNSPWLGTLCNYGSLVAVVASKILFITWIFGVFDLTLHEVLSPLLGAVFVVGSAHVLVSAWGWTKSFWAPILTLIRRN